MGETPQPEKPTTAMRIVLGAVVAAFAWFGVEATPLGTAGST